MRDPLGDEDDDNPVAPDESVLERLDPAILAEVGAWWQDEVADIAADAVETVSAEADCAYDSAIEALSEEFGERADLDEIEEILDERASDAPDDDSDEVEDDEDGDEDEDGEDDDSEDGDDDDDDE